MAFGREIKRLKEKEKISAGKLAAAIGVNADRLRKWMEKDFDPREEDLRIIEERFQMPLEDIMKLERLPKFIIVPNETDETEKEEPKKSYLQQRQNQKLNSGPYMVPLISVRAQAGYSRSYINSDFLNKMESYPIVPGVDPHGAIWRYFQVNGDSMLPFLNNGDYVLSNQIAKEDWPEIKDYHVYVIVTDELVTIKRVFKRKKELVLIAENEKFDQKLVSLDDIKEIWRYRRHIGWNASSPKKFEIKI